MLWPTPQASGTLQLTVMANTAGYWDPHVRCPTSTSAVSGTLIFPVMLWPTPQASGALTLPVMANTAGQWHALICCAMANTTGQWHALFDYGMANTAGHHYAASARRPRAIRIPAQHQQTPRPVFLLLPLLLPLPDFEKVEVVFSESCCEILMVAKSPTSLLGRRTALSPGR